MVAGAHGLEQVRVGAHRLGIEADPRGERAPSDDVGGLGRQKAEQPRHLLRPADGLDVGEIARERGGEVALEPRGASVRGALARLGVPGWRPGLGRREVQAPKVYVSDSGLLAYLLSAGESRIASDDQVTGKLFENFVAMEIVRHPAWAAASAGAIHYRDPDRSRGGEIDLVLEDRSGALVGIEAKAGASVRASDFATLSRLRDERGCDLRAGIVIYAGEQTLPFGDRLWAVPVSALWS
jgi:hypothetical protein